MVIRYKNDLKNWSGTTWQATILGWEEYRTLYIILNLKAVINNSIKKNDFEQNISIITFEKHLSYE